MSDIISLLQLQANQITSVPAEFDFTGEDVSMLPEGVKIEKVVIYPQKVGTVQRIMVISAAISTADLKKITVNAKAAFHPKAPEVFAKYGDLILEIICLGIHNKQSKYPDYLKEFLKANCTWEDLHIFLNAILFRCGTLSFTASTTDLTKVGLKSMEIIAMQENMKSWGQN